MIIDITEKWHNSILQHGKANDRIYLMHVSEEDMPEILPYLNSLADKNHYSKIFAKVPVSAEKLFLKDGYEREAFVPGFYRGEDAALFMGKFLSEKRAQNKDAEKIKNVLLTAQGKAMDEIDMRPKKDLCMRKAGPGDIPAMQEIYIKTFKTYPFPIHKAEYLRKTMNDNVSYYLACKGADIAGVASAEMDRKAQNAEMTDLATLPEHKGEGLATKLIAFMEEAISKKGIVCAYTIARALSYGINIAFARNKYTFSGTLLNNTNIAGSIESMNVWHKKLIR